MTSYKALAIIATLLAGCESIPSVKRAPPPSNAMQECPALKVVSGTINMGKMLDYTVDTVGKYNECRTRHKSLIDYDNR